MLHGSLIGLVLAAQVGPVTLLILRSVLRGGRAVVVGLAMAGAVALVDLLYATAGLAGAGSLADRRPTRVGLGLASAAILAGIGLRTIWTGWQARSGLELAADVVAPERAFLTAVAATALNPLTIALWNVSLPGGPAGRPRSRPGRRPPDRRGARDAHLVRRAEVRGGGRPDGRVRARRLRRPDRVPQPR